MVANIEDRRLLQCLHDILAEIKDEVNPAMPIQQAIAFVLVGLNEGASLKELVKIAEVKQATMSRHLIDLGTRNRHLEPGYNLVACRQDPMELRKNQYTLSPKGHALINKIINRVKDHGYLRG